MSYTRFPKRVLLPTVTSVNGTIPISDDAPNHFSKLTNSSTGTVLVPTNASKHFPIGCSLIFQKLGTGDVIFSPDTGVTLISRLGYKMAGYGSIATLIKTNLNEWMLSGDLVGIGTLTDGSSVAVDAANNTSSLTMTGSTSRTISNPTGAYDGAKILFRLIQGSGNDTVVWDTQYEFTTGVPAPTLSTASGSIDYVAFIYYEATSKWHCLATNANGYT